jgi:hypothetical protein
MDMDLEPLVGGSGTGRDRDHTTDIIISILLLIIITTITTITIITIITIITTTKPPLL